MTPATALWLVTRIMHVHAPVATSQIQALAELPGVHSVTCRQNCMIVQYDVRQTRYGVVADALALSQSGMLVRLRRAWFDNLDRNCADSLQIRSGACCNQPPVRR